MTNAAGLHRDSVAAELLALYANRKDSSRIRDIVVMPGTAGGNSIHGGYDMVTGVGSPLGLQFDK